MTTNVIHDPLAPNQDPWENVDDATFETILASLPVGDYFSFHIVNRRWGSIIHSPTFPKTSKDLFKRLPWMLMMNFLLPSSVVYDMEVKDWRNIHLSIPVANEIPATPLAASGGLLCCLSEANDLFVCNPLTGRSRDIIRLAVGVHYKAITMRVNSPSSYEVFVVQLKKGCLLMRVFSPVVNRTTEYHFKLRSLVPNNEDENNYIRLPMSRYELVPPVRGTYFVNRMPTKACIVRDAFGEPVVYYFESNGRLVGCSCRIEMAYMLPPIPLNRFAFDLVEFHDWVFVMTLAKEDETMMLRVWEFDFMGEQWINVGTMPPQMSEGYNVVNPMIDCTSCGNFITICVSAMDHDFNKVVVFNPVDITWKELPICVDPHCGQPRRFSAALSFMPSIEDKP